jgi:hypothetical protein
MRLVPGFVGVKLYDEAGTYDIELCVEITDKLPPDHSRDQKGPHYIAFAQSAPGEWIVELIYGRLARGFRLSLADLQNGYVFDRIAVFRLERSEITIDQYKKIVLGAAKIAGINGRT